MKIAIPYASEPRADTGLTNTQMGIWLFLASEVMLFGGLFSAYAFIRAAAPNWPSGTNVLSTGSAAFNTALLLNANIFVWRARQSTKRMTSSLWIASVIGAGFLLLKAAEWYNEIGRGLLPSTSNFMALYFTLTGLHAVHVFGGIIANCWTATGLRRAGPEVTTQRTYALSLYWTFVDIVWLAIFLLMYLL